MNCAFKLIPPRTVVDRPLRAGFTLLELITVVGMLCLLACILSPALGKTRQSSNALQCLNNARHLSLAWKMYADDSRSWLVPNRDGADAGKSVGSPSWSGGWLDFIGSNSDNTNSGLLVNHALYPYGAYLGPYLNTPAVFKCPSDKSTTASAPKLPRVRTYSMNNRVGHLARSWSAPTAFLLYTTVDSLIAPRPSELFIFVEEREDSINDPVFLVDPDTPGAMIDFPAAYHNAAGVFGLADGHAEAHRWQDPRTTPFLSPGTYLELVVVLTNNVDVLWLQEHSAAKR